MSGAVLEFDVWESYEIIRKIKFQVEMPPFMKLYKMPHAVMCNPAKPWKHWSLPTWAFPHIFPCVISFHMVMWDMIREKIREGKTDNTKQNEASSVCVKEIWLPQVIFLSLVCAPWARSNGWKSRTRPDSGKCIAEQQECPSWGGIWRKL